MSSSKRNILLRQRISSINEKRFCGQYFRPQKRLFCEKLLVQEALN